MAKKTKKDSYQGDPGDEHVEKVVEPQVEETFEETVVVETPKTKRVEKKNPTLVDVWEIKDRIYKVKGNKKPL